MSRCLVAVLFILTLSSTTSAQAQDDSSRASAAAPPKLVLQITVDQLRGDLHRRYLPKMGAGGFRYLLDQGIVYEDAHHAHANTETIVGHATLATGAHPSAHGLIGNVWLDRASGEMTYRPVVTLSYMLDYSLWRLRCVIMCMNSCVATSETSSMISSL